MNKQIPAALIAAILAAAMPSGALAQDATPSPTPVASGGHHHHHRRHRRHHRHHRHHHHHHAAAAASPSPAA